MKVIPGLHLFFSPLFDIQWLNFKITRSVLPLDDLHDARSTITEQNRRLHEMEIELRRLENEREELSAAYKEAEAVSKFLS